MDPYPTSPFEGQRYSYTMGNPANHTDPSGMRHVAIGSCGVSAYGPDQYYTYSLYPYGYWVLYGAGTINCRSKAYPDELALQVCIVRDTWGPWNAYYCSDVRAQRNTRSLGWSYNRRCPVPDDDQYRIVVFATAYTHGKKYYLDAGTSWETIWC